MNKPDDDSLWVWKSNKGYWHEDKGWTTKDKATVYPWWRAKLAMTAGNGQWESQ